MKGKEKTQLRLWGGAVRTQADLNMECIIARNNGDVSNETWGKKQKRKTQIKTRLTKFFPRFFYK